MHDINDIQSGNTYRRSWKYGSFPSFSYCKSTNLLFYQITFTINRWCWGQLHPPRLFLVLFLTFTQSLSEEVEVVLLSDTSTESPQNFIVHKTWFYGPQIPHLSEEARRSKYWNKWPGAIHDEDELLKAKNVYDEVENLLSGKKGSSLQFCFRSQKTSTLTRCFVSKHSGFYSNSLTRLQPRFCVSRPMGLTQWHPYSGVEMSLRDREYSSLFYCYWHSTYSSWLSSFGLRRLNNFKPRQPSPTAQHGISHLIGRKSA